MSQAQPCPNANRPEAASTRADLGLCDPSPLAGQEPPQEPIRPPLRENHPFGWNCGPQGSRSARLPGPGVTLSEADRSKRPSASAGGRFAARRDRERASRFPPPTSPSSPPDQRFSNHRPESDRGLFAQLFTTVPQPDTVCLQNWGHGSGESRFLRHGPACHPARHGVSAGPFRVTAAGPRGQDQRRQPSTFFRNGTRWLKKMLFGYAPAGSLWA
jgi:hypothetical protein